MGKNKIKVILESSETKNTNNTTATIEDNNIKYKEPDATNVTLNTKDNILIRENEKLLMEFNFDIDKITENTLYVKDLKQTLIIIIKTMNIICKKNYYKVEYEIIDNDKFNYIVEVGVTNEQD